MGAGAPDFYHPQFRVVTAAGTSQSAPLTTDLGVSNQVLDEVEIRIPPGSNGLVGFRVLWTGAQLLPWGPGPDWIVGNDETLHFEVGLEIGGQLVMASYNLDGLAHMLLIRLQVHDVYAGQLVGAVQPLPAAAIDAAARTLVAG